MPLSSSDSGPSPSLSAIWFKDLAHRLPRLDQVGESLWVVGRVESVMLAQVASQHHSALVATPWQQQVPRIMREICESSYSLQSWVLLTSIFHLK